MMNFVWSIVGCAIGATVGVLVGNWACDHPLKKRLDIHGDIIIDHAKVINELRGRVAKLEAEMERETDVGES